MKRALLAFAVLTLMAPLAHADGDAAKGEKVFKKCMACHNVDKAQNKVGPHLDGVVGRAAASIADYAYSDAMKAKGAEGMMWTEDNLAKYLADPKTFVPKNKMAFVGLKKEDEIADVIAFLKGHPKL